MSKHPHCATSGATVVLSVLLVSAAAAGTVPQRFDALQALAPPWHEIAAHDVGRCDRSRMLCSPKQVREAFEATEPVTRDAGTLKRPASVADDILVRAMTSPSSASRATVLGSYSLTVPGKGKWFVFVGGHDLVEKALVAGQYEATAVFRNFGYGSNFVCNSDTTSYWLAIFRRTPQIAVMDAVWENLQAWMYHVYRREAPRIPGEVLETLESERFAELTDCQLNADGKLPDSLPGCNAEFVAAVDDLRASSTCADAKAMRYSPQAGCPTDAVLASFGRDPDALSLRAYLYVAGSFFEYYTGYGYSANWYNQPIGHEYWTDNRMLKDLPEIQLLQVQCTSE